MVPVGSGAREGPTHGVLGGGRSVDGCGRQLWCVMRVGGVGRGGRSRAGLWGSVACGGGGCVLPPVSYYEEVMRVKTARGLRPESLGRGDGALAAGYPRLGWLGCPGAPWGRRLPTSAGCETTARISVTVFLRFRPQELPRRGDCWPGRPWGTIMKRKWGARMSLAVGTFLRPGGGRCRGYYLSLVPVVRWWVVVWYPATGVCARCRGHRPPLGAGMKRPVASPPLHNSPPGDARPLAPAVVAGGARGSAGPLRSPGGPDCPYNATRGGVGRTARAGRAAPAGVGDRGGQGGVRGSRQVDGGWRGLVPRTSGPHHPPVGRRGCRGSGVPPRGLRPPPCSFGVGEGRQRPLAAMTHGA